MFSKVKVPLGDILCSFVPFIKSSNMTRFSPLADEMDLGVLVKSQWEAGGFPPQRASVSQCCLCSLISFACWSAGPSWAGSELLACVVLSPVLLLCLLLLPQSRHWAYFLQCFLSPTSLTASVTYRSSENPNPRTQCAQPLNPRSPQLSVQGSCLWRDCWGVPPVASLPGFCFSLVTQMSLLLAVYIPKVKYIPCFPDRNVHEDN